MIKPTGSSLIIGDTLVISEQTDVDSIIVSFGDNIASDIRKLEANKKIGTFSAFKVALTPDSSSFQYTMKLAQATVPTSHVPNHDVPLSVDKK